MVSLLAVLLSVGLELLLLTTLMWAIVVVLLDDDDDGAGMVPGRSLLPLFSLDEEEEEEAAFERSIARDRDLTDSLESSLSRSKQRETR